MREIYRKYLFWRLERLLVDEAGLEAHVEALYRVGETEPPLEEALARARIKIKSLRAKLFPHSQETS